MNSHPFFRTLKGKAALFIVALSMAGLVALLSVFIATERSMMGEFQNEKLHLVEDFVVGTLKPMMLTGHGNLMSEVMANYQRIPELKEVQIVRVNGIEAFTDSETMDRVNQRLGEKRFTRPLKPARQLIAPDNEHLKGVLASGRKEVFSRRLDDENTMKMMFPISNEEMCHGCHGDDHAIRGVLVATFAMTKEDRQVMNDMLRLSVIAFLVVLATSFGTLFFFNRMVASRITGIIAQVNGIVATEQFASRIRTDHRDELDDLSIAFNHFIASVELYRQAEEQEKERLETMVRERTRELQEKNDFIENDLKVARRIQHKLLPERFPENPAAEFNAAYLPCLHLGGDYYDVFEMPNHHVGVFLADASGHGSSAALIMAIVKSLVTTIGKDISSPSYVVQLVNNTLAKMTPDDSYCTLFYAVLDTRNGKMVYSLAGHPPPIIVNRFSGAVKTLETNGSLVGVFDFDRFEDSEITLEPGDRLFAYTDGIIEAEGVTTREGFGRKRLGALLVEHREDGTGQIIKTALDSLNAYTGNAPLADDVTLLVVDYLYRGKMD